MEELNITQNTDIPELFFLHSELKKYCVPDYKNEDYRDSIKKAFDIVRGEYRKRFNDERIPEKFLELFYITGTLSNNGEQPDKDFQKACCHLFRSINHFRNEKEHTDVRVKANKQTAVHYLYLCSMVLSFLDRLDYCPNNTHPFNRDDYKSEKMGETIQFDYSNNNGQYQIGNGLYVFTIKVSECGDNSLYLYNDPPNIKGIGLINKTYQNLQEIKDNDLKNVDMSSRTRAIGTGNTGVLLNNKNIYAVLKLKKATRNDNHIAVIEYCIFNGRKKQTTTRP